MTRRSFQIALLLLGSGTCALLYQIAWLREFRLVFGASTAASAAVLAIFIGGLGLGSRLIGPRADTWPNPLRLYAGLEAAIALSAAVTPPLLWLVREIYIGLGGSNTLGTLSGSLVRLLLSALVLLIPTLLMGGTLPAAARAAERDGDRARRAVALLYATNTLGAVCGSFLGTFFLIEAVGNRWTLWLAALLNLGVAGIAWQLARTHESSASPAISKEPLADPGPPAAPPAFVLFAAGAVGFAFFLMEIVWYRMLGPLLGGSVFTFGLILSMALLGIGLGGALYAIAARDRPATLHAFAMTCLLEAALIALPLALGDRLALLTLLLRPLGQLGFAGHLLAWTSVTTIVVVPAALLAGYQFPLLIALLGEGRRAVGRHVGHAYAWNTVGAILGSLAGGFGLLPLLGAPNCWRLAVVLLALLGLGAAFLGRCSAPGRGLWPLAPAAIALAMLMAPGPSAAWRHSGIGAGRAASAGLTSPNRIEEWLRRERAAARWEREGVESSVALRTQLGVAFVINGKVDGHATLDAPTQVMSGLLLAALHPAPRTALVIGLGTGSTGGWLGVTPGIERVDVVELEPAILDVAARLSAVNHDVLSNPRVRIQIGDAREVLLTSPDRYDLIFSEPSNPYRAGIASLFTHEYYEAVEERLSDGGLFLQWVQGYEVDATTVRTVLSTLRTVFPAVEASRSHRDLFLLASRQPQAYDATELRARLGSFPLDVGLRTAWRVEGLEGFLAHYVAAPPLLDTLAAQEPQRTNTDDRNLVEFGFARTVGRGDLFDLRTLRDLARQARQDRPAMTGDVDWARVEELRHRLYDDAPASGPAATRLRAVEHYAAGRLEEALNTWVSQPRPPEDPIELALVAEGLADRGAPEADPAIAALGAGDPAAGLATRARWAWRQGRSREALVALLQALEAHRNDPWPVPALMLRGLDVGRELAAADPVAAARLFEALQIPFAGFAIDDARHVRALEIATLLGPGVCRQALAPFEPWVPWRADLLRYRRDCYRDTGDPAVARAEAEWARYLSAEPAPLAP